MSVVVVIIVVVVDRTPPQSLPLECGWSRGLDVDKRPCRLAGNDLYAIGGRQFDSHLHAAFGLRAKTLNSVERYDCTKDSWSKVANLQVGLFAHAGTLRRRLCSVGVVGEEHCCLLAGTAKPRSHRTPKQICG